MYTTDYETLHVCVGFKVLVTFTVAKVPSEKGTLCRSGPLSPGNPALALVRVVYSTPPRVGAPRVREGLVTIPSPLS